MYRIDLNADLGESFGAYMIGSDAEVIPLITSANVACGFHGGDPAVMMATVERCHQHGVGIGAHPSYPDKVGFGRRVMAATEEEVYADLLYQTGALYAFARARSTRLSHVKPHGALYNQAFKDVPTARAIARATRDFDPDLPLFAQPHSALAREAERIGVPVIYEVFADRAYNADGSLVSRKLPGSVIHDPEQAAAQVVRMVKEGLVRALDGTDVTVKADSVCVHGDNPQAVELIRCLRRGLTDAGITIVCATNGR